MQYVCAVKRALRDDPNTPSDWAELLRAMPGVAVVGEPMFGRMTIEIAPEDLPAIEAAFGRFLHLEPLTYYAPLQERSKD